MKNEFSPRVDGYKIYVDQLKHGHVEKIEERFAPSFLEINENALAFEEPVLIKGEAYVADDNLILHLTVTTSATIPCSICNEPVKVPIELSSFYHAESLTEIKSGIFSMLDPLREAILLEAPLFAECSEGNCPQRKEVEKYLKAPTEEDDEDNHYRPFEGLKLE